MTIFALMPVFNRVEMTKKMLEDLATQVVDEALSIIVIDDGSFDGTGEFLKTRSELTVLKGDGALWWGGAVDAGITHVLSRADDSDWILLINNDTRVQPDFVQSLLDVARAHAPAAVGSVLREDVPPHRLLSVGPLINAQNVSISDVLSVASRCRQLEAENSVEVDALSGRGALFPVKSLRVVGGMRKSWLPHYLADYELAVRVKKAGWRLLVAFSAVTYSKPEFGNSYRGETLLQRYFSRRSPSYLPAQLRFWWVAGNAWQRLTLPLRIGVLMLYRILYKKS